ASVLRRQAAPAPMRFQRSRGCSATDAASIPCRSACPPAMFRLLPSAQLRAPEPNRKRCRSTLTLTPQPPTRSHPNRLHLDAAAFRVQSATITAHPTLPATILPVLRPTPV